MSLAFGDPVMFAINLALIVGAVIVAVVLFLLVIAAWTGVNIGVWRHRRRQADEVEDRRKLRPDGQPYPPAARGLCSGCQRVHETVYHLPSGERLCRACYDAQLEEST